jgi:hypothetical protein
MTKTQVPSASSMPATSMPSKPAMKADTITKPVNSTQDSGKKDNTN